MNRRLGRALWLAGTPARLGLLSLVRIYRALISGLLGGRCRFYPSCSAYAEQAIRECGVTRGVVLSVWRVLRCSPLSHGGVDYPPRGPVYDALIQQADHRMVAVEGGPPA